MKFDVIIIGGGAAGLMCAMEASKRERKVLVLESEEKVGKKILISGGGRCNFTNLYIEPESYLSHNPHFCKSSLARYTPWDFIALMDRHKLSWNEKKLGQLFCNEHSPAILRMLLIECENVENYHMETIFDKANNRLIYNRKLKKTPKKKVTRNIYTSKKSV